MPPGTSARYMPGLDGLRGVAILLVMACHAGWLRGGYLGVDLFFVLSGFLITSLLFEEHGRTGSIHLGRFWARRLLRLYPPLLIVVSATWIFARVIEPSFASTISGRQVSAILFYYANIPLAFGLFGIGSLQHCWSLAIEEHFYILWPPVCALLLRRSVRPRTVLLALVSTALAIAMWRLWLVDQGVGFARVYFATDTRTDGLLIGCALGVAAHLGRLPGGRKAATAFWFGLVAFAAMVVAGSAAPYSETTLTMGRGGFLVAALGAASMLPLLAAAQSGGSRVERVFTSRPLVWTGKISYGLYLVHLPVLVYGKRLFEGTDSGAAEPWTMHALRLALCGVAVGIAAGIYYAVDRPVARWRRELRARRPDRSASSPAAAIARSGRSPASAAPHGSRR